MPDPNIAPSRYGFTIHKPPRGECSELKTLIGLDGVDVELSVAATGCLFTGICRGFGGSRLLENPLFGGIGKLLCLLSKLILGFGISRFVFFLLCLGAELANVMQEPFVADGSLSAWSSLPTIELVAESDPDKAEPSAAFSDLFNTASGEGRGKKRPDLFK